MLTCMHNKKVFGGIMLVKTNPPSLKAGYGPVGAKLPRFLSPASFRRWVNTETRSAMY